jgi:hypothetical protein
LIKVPKTVKISTIQVFWLWLVVQKIVKFVKSTLVTTISRARCSEIREVIFEISKRLRLLSDEGPPWHHSSRDALVLHKIGGLIPLVGIVITAPRVRLLIADLIERMRLRILALI